MEKIRKFSSSVSRAGLLVCSFLLILVMTLTSLAADYEVILNNRLGTSSTKVVNKDGSSSADSQYFRSSYGTIEELYAAKMELMEEIAREGTVLLKNENNALPMESGSITVYGSDQFIIGTNQGGGSLKPETLENAAGIAQALEAAGLQVSTEAGTKSDAALVVLGRVAGEGADLEVGSLKLTDEEKGWIDQAKANSGKVIVLTSGDFSVELADLVNDDQISAILHLGNAGYRGAYGFADVLTGEVSPSGRLVETLAADSMSSPAMMNFGDYSYTNASAVMASQAKKYVVYAEGIYQDYKYYETRYEDCVLGQGNAGANVGVYAENGAWNYGDEVIYSFGYGLSYGSFTQELQQVVMDEAAHTAKVSVKVTNTSDRWSGKEAVQVYAQSPYTDYDRENGVEKASVQLVGFGKTDTLAPGESQVVDVDVNLQWLASYDANKTKGYIMDAGDYYFAIGSSAHDALNNILAAKGKTVADGMDGAGDAGRTYTWHQETFDDTTYAASVYTGEEVTNAFEDADLNYWMDDNSKITYLTRNHWDTTYPKTVQVTASQDMLDSLNDSQKLENGTWNDAASRVDADKDITQGESGEGKTAAAMIGLEYDDPAWEELLDQLSYEEISNTVANGNGRVQAMASVGFPEVTGSDSPIGMSANYLYAAIDPETGEKTELGDSHMIKDELLGKEVDMTKVQAAMFASEPVLGSTFNTELAEKQGDMYAEDGFYTGNTFTWGLGLNLHRTPYGGRASEYYSADPVHTALMGAAQTKGALEKGHVIVAKHFAVNEQEQNRIGVGTFLNEQTLRENLLRAFEGVMTYGESKGIMASYNRLGLLSTPTEYDLMTTVLRKEWGFDGYVITDLNGPTAGLYDGNAMIVAGTNTLLNNGPYDSASGAYINCTLNPENIEKDPVLLTQAREAVHRLMYVYVNSAAMNGISADSTIEFVTPWWKALILTLDVIFGILTAGFAVLYLAFAMEKKTMTEAAEWGRRGRLLLAALLNLAGILAFLGLTRVSYEAAENPVTVYLWAGIAIVLAVVGLFKKLGALPSLLSYLATAMAFCSMLSGRASYLAFYFSGDVMDTGLSAWLIVAALLFLAAAAVSGLSSKKELPDKKGLLTAAKTCWILPAIVVVFGVIVLVTTGGGASAKLEKPTEDVTKWQAYTKEEYAEEDVSEKKVVYQFDGIGPEGSDAAGVGVLINLYEDGFAKLYQVLPDGSIRYEYNGYWTNQEETGLFFCFASYVYVGESNSMVEKGDIATVDYAYNVQLSGKEFSGMTVNICLGFADGGQFVRSLEISGGDGKPEYEEAKDFAKTVKP